MNWKEVMTGLPQGLVVGGKFEEGVLWGDGIGGLPSTNERSALTVKMKLFFLELAHKGLLTGVFYARTSLKISDQKGSSTTRLIIN